MSFWSVVQGPTFISSIFPVSYHPGAPDTLSSPQFLGIKHPRAQNLGSRSLPSAKDLSFAVDHGDHGWVSMGLGESESQRSWGGEFLNWVEVYISSFRRIQNCHPCDMEMNHILLVHGKLAEFLFYSRISLPLTIVQAVPCITLEGKGASFMS